MSQHSRLAAYGDVSTSLALRGDHELAALLESAVPLGTGIGGTSVLLEVEGRPVFVKRVALTDLEREPANVRSTANVYDLPAFCQYGIGSPGFGAWRELAAHTMTTNWVLTGQFAGFPLMYHWRVLPHSAPAPVEELADVDRAVGSWAGGKRPIGTPGGIAEILSRHSPLAAVMNGFYRGLQSESRKTPYPLEEIRRVLG